MVIYSKALSACGREGDRLLGVIARVIDTPSRAWGEKIAWFEYSATTINPAPQHVYT